MAGSKRKWESHDFEEEDLSVYPGEKKKIKSDLDHKQQNIIDDEPWPPWPWLTEAAFATAELGTRYMHIETGQKMMSLHNTLSDIISELSEDVIIHKVFNTHVDLTIGYKDKEQVIEESEIGLKLIIPSSSIKSGQTINIKANVTQFKKSDVFFPESIERVSYYYRIEANKFQEPIQICLQHEKVKVYNRKELVFLISRSTSPPYEFQCVPVEQCDFNTMANSGILYISEFSVRWLFIGWIVDYITPTYYSMSIYHKKIGAHTWRFDILITTTDSSIIEKIENEYRREGWTFDQQFNFTFYSTFFVENVIKLREENEYFTLQSLRPNQVKRDEIHAICDNPNPVVRSLPRLEFRISKKSNCCSPTDLKLVFDGTNEINENQPIVIESSQLDHEIYPIANSAGHHSRIYNPRPSNHDISKYLESKPLLTQLLEVLPPIVAKKYHTIGAYLNVDFRYLTLNGEDEDKLSAVLERWLKTDDCIRPANWYVIIEMFEKSIIQDINVAKKIKTYLKKPKVKQDIVSAQLNS